MILGLLLGNTSLRHGTYGGGSIIESGRIGWDELDAGRGGLPVAGGAREAVIGSVRDDRLERVIELLPEGLPVAVARRDFPLPIENRYARPAEAGTDRLLNAIAAHARAKGRPAIVVDFGTAISVSVTSSGGDFLGGLIAAGGRTAARGLAGAAPRLPAVEPRDRDAYIRTDTASAIEAGLYHLVTGGVRKMLQGISAELSGGPARVFATGGEASLFAPGIPEIDEVVPDLGLEGLFAAHAAWRASRPGR